tara:strand:- start:13 stop:453 length:441 start_codon:yes stop_codon:yes gene_type:complete
MTERKWGEWKKVDLTTYPFFLKDEILRLQGKEPIEAKKHQILMDIFSLELGNKDLEYFDPEDLKFPPRIPDELKIYCPVEEQNTKFWPGSIGNTEEHMNDWDKWFYLDHSCAYEVVSAYRNRHLGSGWYLVEWEGLSPIIIRPIKE